MSLAAAPDPPRFVQQGSPFLVTAVWVEGFEDREDRAWGQLHIAAAEYPGARSHELAIDDPLCRPLLEVEAAELPIALQLIRREEGWAFEYLGGPEFFSSPEHHGGAAAALSGLIAPAEPPQLRSPEEIKQAEEAMLRESLGIAEGEPLPEPAGPLPPEQAGEEPYRFDPTPHMDFSTADPAPPLPPPAPPGPAPTEGSRLPAPVPPPGKPLGRLDPDAEPFAH